MAGNLFQQVQTHRVMISRVVWVALFLYVFGYERIPVMPLESPLGLIGVATVLLGLTVRSLSAGMLHKNEVLATTGIYAIVRNPLYFGSLLLLLGLNIIIADPLTLVVSIALFALTYVPTIRGEEAGLARTYAEQWQAYVASTPRLLPRLTKLGELGKINWSFQQWQRNHEQSTIIAAVVILALLEVYSRYLGA